MLMTSAAKNIGYTNFNGTSGTVTANIKATAKLANQLIVSNTNLSGLLDQSSCTNLTVRCQSIIKVYGQL